MNNTDSNLIQLFSSFKDVKYDSSQYRYAFDDGKIAISINTFVNKFVPPFNAREVAIAIAPSRNTTPELLLLEWAEKAVLSTTRGKILHEYMESMYHGGSYFNYLSSKIQKDMLYMINRDMNKKSETDIFSYDSNKNETIRAEINRQVGIITKNHIPSFLKDTESSFVPISAEYLVADKLLGLCGFIDNIIYSKKLNCLIVVDWKFNNSGDIFNSDKKGFINVDGAKIENSDYNKFSLVISLYIRILQRAGVIVHNTGFIVLFDSALESYKLYPTADCKEIVDYLCDKLDSGFRW